MRNSMLIPIVLVLMRSPAQGQSTEFNAPPQAAQSSNVTGVIGPSAQATQPPEYVPMTASERFRLYLRRTYGIGSLFKSAAGAGSHQWGNTPKEWKQSAEAYGDRLGSSLAIHTIRGTLRYGASAALHKDDRYVRARDTGFWRRSKHAVRETFIARNDVGHEHFAYSRFGSAAGAAFISRIWQPRSTNSAGDGAEVFGLAIGLDVGHNMLREFWPDVKRHLFKKD
jgi:hypothetical protein